MERRAAAAGLAAAAALFAAFYLTLVGRPAPHIDEVYLASFWVDAVRSGEGLFHAALWNPFPYRGGLRVLFSGPFIALLGWTLSALRLQSAVVFAAVLVAVAGFAWRRVSPAAAALSALLLAAEPSFYFFARQDYANVGWSALLGTSAIFLLWDWEDGRGRGRGAAAMVCAGLAVWTNLLALFTFAAWAAASASRATARRFERDAGALIPAFAAGLLPFFVGRGLAAWPQLMEMTFLPHTNAPSFWARLRLISDFLSGSHAIGWIFPPAAWGPPSPGPWAMAAAAVYALTPGAAKPVRRLAAFLLCAIVLFPLFPQMNQEHHAAIVLSVWPWILVGAAASDAARRARGARRKAVIAAAGALVLAAALRSAQFHRRVASGETGPLTRISYRESILDALAGEAPVHLLDQQGADHGLRFELGPRREFQDADYLFGDADPEPGLFAQWARTLDAGDLLVFSEGSAERVLPRARTAASGRGLEPVPYAVVEDRPTRALSNSGAVLPTILIYRLRRAEP